MAFSTLLTVLVLIHNTGGLLGAEVRSSIIGGQDAPKGRWPGMVHLNLTDGKGVKWRCGGTILNSQWVLTAANCWEREPAPLWRRSFVAVGLDKLQKAGSRYMEISTVMSNPDYNRVTYINDIALVKLKKTVRFEKNVAPVSLDRADTFGPSSECWIVGWGYKGTNDPLPDPETLQELKISIIPHSVCKAKYPALTSDQLCAGGVEAGGKDACQGDYGGPLMCRAADGGEVQVGIMSYGSPAGCGLPGRPGVYTKVFKYLSFIDAYTKQGEEAPAEV
ncbi:tryptase-2-like [Sebastes fasciatus]|uniref:tryptase-2-like n=1 Tax=Sebastes fasciatus TaxID=394691 RepID=UPI003D9F6FB4